jgi:hypothetical protein
MDDMSLKSIYVSSSYDGFFYFGLGIDHLDLGEAVEYNESNEKINSYDIYEMSSELYGAIAFKEVSVGIGVKYIRSRLTNLGAGFGSGDGAATTYAVDLGV